MSQENVELVKRVFDAVARRDTDAVLACYHPDVEFDLSQGSIAGLIGKGVYRGHDGLRRWFREWYEAWGSLQDDCEELIDAGEHVISVVTRRGRGRASGAETTARRGGVWTLRDGKVVRLAGGYRERSEALEAAGLSE
jgi:ketosteroid isomerase-like protein